MNISNILTIIRIAIIPIIVLCIYLTNPYFGWIAFILFCLAGITDYFDGYLARLRNEVTNFGTFLDPIADKLLVAAVILILTSKGVIKDWDTIPALIILLREITVSGLREYLAGIKVVQLRLMAFALTGLGAAGAGLMYASRVASANPTQGSGLMLDAIAAVFLGMTMSRQGEPKVLYTLVGVLILGVLDNGMTQLRVDSYVREILVGLIVIAAVAVASLSKRSL
mgnify:CR=1 FL=1